VATKTHDIKYRLTAQDLTGPAFKRAEGGLTGISSAARLAGAAIGSIGLAAIARDMGDAVSRFQKLEASLITVTGSSDKAARSMAWLTEFASTTPFQLDTVVESFIKMQALGLNPTEDALRSFGNTSAAMGKDLMQFIEAVADASVGEFERLKEFGVKARSEGNKVSFTFQGVTTTVKKNADEITSYLESLGDVQFAGGMERQMQTIEGVTSNLADSWDRLLVALGNSGPAHLATQAISSLTEAMTRLRQEIAPTIDEQLVRLQSHVAQIDDQLKGQDQFLNLDSGLGNLFAKFYGSREELEAEKERIIEQIRALQTEANAIRASAAGEGGDGTPAAPSTLSTVEINAARQSAAGLHDLWLDQANERWEVKSRELDVLLEMEQNAADIQAAQWSYGTDLWLANIEERQAAETRAIAMTQQQREIAAGAAIGILGALQSSALQSTKKGFEIAKVAAIAETSINTYKAATGAYSALASIPIVGPTLGIAAAAAAVAAGLANVRAIQSQQFGGGGSITPPSFSSGGASTTPVVTQPTPGQETQRAAQQVTVVINGNLIGQDEWVQHSLIPEIQSALDRGATITLESN
jgi:hypothetical protein